MPSTVLCLMNTDSADCVKGLISFDYFNEKYHNVLTLQMDCKIVQFTVFNPFDINEEDNDIIEYHGDMSRYKY